MTYPRQSRQAARANKQIPQMMRASKCRADRRPSRQPPSPMGLATPFFRHLARPKEAEKKEREKVMINSVYPSEKLKMPLPKMIFDRSGTSDRPGPSTTTLLSSLLRSSSISSDTECCTPLNSPALIPIIVIMRAEGTASRNTSCRAIFWSKSFFLFLPSAGSL